MDLSFRREGAFLVVRATGGDAKLSGAHDGELRIPLPGVEVGIPHELPLPGSRTAQLKILSENTDAHSLTLELEAQGGSTYDLPLRVNGVRSEIHASGATIDQTAASSSGLGSVHITFPAGAGYQRQTIHVTW